MQVLCEEEEDRTPDKEIINKIKELGVVSLSLDSLAATRSPTRWLLGYA